MNLSKHANVDILHVIAPSPFSLILTRTIITTDSLSLRILSMTLSTNQIQ